MNYIGIKEANENAKEEGLREGREKGLQEGIEKVAKGMKDNALPINVIAKVTGLSVEVIEKL